MFETSLTAADPGFPRGWRQPLMGHAKLLFDQFARKLLKNEEWVGGGACVPRVSRSANAHKDKADRGTSVQTTTFPTTQTKIFLDL